MRTVIVLTMLMLFASALAFAQQTPSQMEQIHNGRVKVWLGLGLIGTGAWVIPLTATNSNSNGPATLGMGLIALGGGLVWLGVDQQRKAVQPETTFRLMVGRTKGVQIRRSW
jgi:hypothetical protein